VGLLLVVVVVVVVVVGGCSQLFVSASGVMPSTELGPDAQTKKYGSTGRSLS